MLVNQVPKATIMVCKPQVFHDSSNDNHNKEKVFGPFVCVCVASG